MEMREWALITFTILAQMSVGAFLVLGIVQWFAARRDGQEQADLLADRALVAIFPVLALGLLASLLHLGNPINAYKAVTNLGTSWLSREIFTSVLFFVVGGAFALMQWRKIASATVRSILFLVATIIGIALVYCMSNAYILPTRPAWNTITTPFSFYTTALLLGVMAVGAALVANYGYVRRKNPDCASKQCQLLADSLRWIAVVSIVLLGVEFVLLPLTLSLWTVGGAVASAQMMATKYSGLFGLRLSLVFLGAGVLAVFIYQAARQTGKEALAGNLAYLSFALVLIAEVLGRYLFYASSVLTWLQ